jgi:hypothetical protein
MVLNTIVLVGLDGLEDSRKNDIKWQVAERGSCNSVVWIFFLKNGHLSGLR